MTEYRLGIYDAELSRLHATVTETEAESPEMAMLKMLETAMAGRPMLVTGGKHLLIERKDEEGVYQPIGRYEVPETRKSLPTLGGAV